MKRSDLISKIRNNSLVRRFLALLIVLSTVAALVLPGYEILLKVNAANEEETVMPLAEQEDEPFIWLSFDDSDNRLANCGKKDVRAELKGVDIDNIIGTFSVSGNDYDGNIRGTVSGNDNDVNNISAYSGNDEYNFFPNYKEGSNEAYLDLSDPDAYLSLTNADGSGGVLNGLQEMTVEMRVKMKDTDSPYWAFFAAPTAESPEPDHEQYLGIVLGNFPIGTILAEDTSENYKFLTDGMYRLENSIAVQRYANSGKRPEKLPYIEWPVDDNWHKIRVVFKISSTILCVDDDQVIEIGTPYSLQQCVQGENGVLWFGHSSWGEGFNGCIDEIKIWDHAIYDPINEDEYIVTDRVTDPKYTTVNMFDYWITANQGDNDYMILDSLDGTNHDALLQGINDGHLFLFAGETVFSGGPKFQATEAEIGFWNRSSGLEREDEKEENKNLITQGIVQNKLVNGYPLLAIDDSWAKPSALENLWTVDKRNESLAYLFDPDMEVDSKASYPDVTGLFRINDEGYYEFHSWKTFAELNVEEGNGLKTSTSNNHITLYNEKWGWGLPNEHDGQFFPFNDWSDMFYVTSEGRAEQAHINYKIKDIIRNEDVYIDGGSGQTTTDEPLNHYFGMTVETTFQQPIDGMINRGGKQEPMKFTFSGDDDVWIFIDDVLVGDLGGIHGWKNISIDFSTGIIEFKEHSGLNTTLAAMFEEAEKDSTVGWKKSTDQQDLIFPDNSIHTLKFFYLERGNQFSNCNITFNLQEPIADQIRKVDENGDPLAGVEFELYKAEMINDPGSDKRWHTADEFKKIGTPMTTTTSGEDGYAILVTEKGEALQYDVDGYYILEETQTLPGYRKNLPIVLEYHGGTGTLTVVNKYETGAYASFLANWRTRTSEVRYAKFADGEFSISDDTNNVLKDEALIDGLAIVVPLVKSRDTSDDSDKAPIWRPMYGSNTYGWNIVTPDSGSQDDLIEALAVAAIMQIADSTTQDWYLRWDGIQLKGQLDNLPGDATRFVFNNKSDPSKADGDLVTLFLPKDALDELMSTSGTYKDDDERYIALRNALEGKDAETLMELAAGLRNLKILYTDDFEKNNRTVIYVPNEQRELRVRKVDEDGNPMKGAVFALFDTAKHAAVGDATTSVGVMAYGTTGKNGELIFRANSLTGSEAGYGYAKMDWDSDRTDDTRAVYWLKEITAPEGYALNQSLIRVEVGNAGIYANATGFDSDGKLLTGDAAENDGIQVEASLGRLNQTMIKYAEGIVDETLKYITVTKQTTSSNDGVLDINAWYDGNSESEDRIYDNDNGYAPVVKFTTDEGYIRVMPRQTRLTEGIPDPTAKRDILTDTGQESGEPINLDGLFSLINTVVVTDRPTTGNLTVTKTVEVPEGEEIDAEAEFTFTVKLSDTGINGDYGDMTFKDGVAAFTLKHRESKTANGLPAGIKYTVVENDYAEYTVTKSGDVGTIMGGSTATAAFTNTQKVTPTAPPVDTPNPADTPNSPAPPGGQEITVTRDHVPQTGDNRHLGPWLATLVLSLIVMGMSFRTLRRKRFLHEEEKHLK